MQKLGVFILKRMEKIYETKRKRELVLAGNLTFFFVASFTWNWRKMLGFFLFFGSKNETGCGFIHETDWNYETVQIRSGKKIETDGRGEAACRQFQFFFPDRIWRFHNFMSVSCMKPSASFIFWCQKIRKIPTFFRQFNVKLCHNKIKKEVRFFAET